MTSKIKIANRVAYFLVPFLTLILGNTIIYSIASTISHRGSKAVTVALLGLILFILLIWLTRKLAHKALIRNPRIGKLNDFAIGAVLGLMISCISAFLYVKTHDLNFEWAKFSEQISYSATVSIASATVEETVFRFCIVHGTAALTNPTFGLIAGSLPFGFGHLLNKFSGQSVTMEQVIGITVAGLMLSLIFLRFGLWAAIGCHYVWNALSGPWVKGMALGDQGISSFEGAWTTTLVLSFFFVLLFWQGKGKCKMTTEQNTSL